MVFRRLVSRAVAGAAALAVLAGGAPAAGAAPAPAQDAAAPAPAAAAGLDAPLPSKEELVRKVRRAVRLDYELQHGYTYIEVRRDVKVSKLGKVTVGPLRTFEVYPSSQPGRTYKRLIAIDGKPLDPEELARRDAEHRQNMINQAEALKNETPEQREKRLEKEAKERRERDALIEDAFAVFEPTIVGREVVDGYPVVLVTLRPRPYSQPKTREGRWMKKFSGRMWVDDTDGQIVKIDMVADDDITVGWGIVGRVHKGSRLVFSRRKVNDEVWLPASSYIDASGRTLLFRRFDVELRTEYRDYKKWSVDTTVSFSVPD
ncbi:MAG TPA: hypothetical protein VIL35_13910 [Vicinamibacterales bacterium]